MDDDITLEVVAPVLPERKEEGSVKLMVTFNVVRKYGSRFEPLDGIGTVVCMVPAADRAAIKEARKTYILKPKRKRRSRDPLGLWKEAGIRMERVAAEDLRLVMTSCEECGPRSSRYPKPLEVSR